MRPSYALSVSESEDDLYPTSKSTPLPLKENPETNPQSSPIRQRQPADDPSDLSAQLLRELERLGVPSGDAEQGEDAARLVRAYLHHGQLLVWRHVAHGNLSAPRQLLDAFRAALPFADVHAPELDFVQTAAIEVHSTVRAWHVAEQALAEASARQGLADRDRSKLERAVLGALLANSESYLRRKQVHGLLPLEGRPTVGRVGQILSKLADEGFVSRRRDRAQGDPETAFYAINDRGKDAARRAFISPTRAAEVIEASPNDRDKNEGILAGVVANARRRSGRGDLADVGHFAEVGLFLVAQALRSAIVGERSKQVRFAHATADSL